MGPRTPVQGPIEGSLALRIGGSNSRSRLRDSLDILASCCIFGLVAGLNVGEVAGTGAAHHNGLNAVHNGAHRPRALASLCPEQRYAGVYFQRSRAVPRAGVRKYGRGTRLFVLELVLHMATAANLRIE